ncbi:cellulose biosynthesis protein BcsN [Rhizobium oryzicola]|uniref:Cellulose biosynthesis protein BcsN n=1 Tax=Rhizobium oryzicola TaxID=1232668 RepID=A0ABT8T2W1_9HYPH|nr:cellulose biosynthesis protein BcsN [Rhizobium oryzicola]MDO1585075.1 cellulose biosynthesis protein BcsN [Rhizobium oryzicola]
MSSDSALVMPPPGGPAVRGVVSSQHSNGTEQTVLLATTARIAGQNYFKVQYAGGTDPDSNAPSGSYRPISGNSIAAEAARAIPGIRMTPSNQLLQNSYGPFSYASGRSPMGDTCLFAWQQIRSRSTPTAIGRNFGMIQVRMRLCDAHASERDLLNVMYGYTLTGTFVGNVWNPHGQPPGVDEDVISGRKLIEPAGVSSMTTSSIGVPRNIVVQTSPARPASRPVAAAQSAPVVQPATAVPAVVIPMPPVTAATAPSATATTPVIPLPGCSGASNASGC